ncbi:tetratricopeptide repeat protein [Peredibacter starrii]|uniref:Tetratricopeptide repeat protein n=1 Tax=Peredibacter starrii TaxID=28202 RepID=A0AAX4HQ62_9BACT|nr:hypothetical protein [Peredibacter starrii]WPU65437.1 hypothetical protein SOO65_01620 [Peredibacter starrii]
MKRILLGIVIISVMAIVSYKLLGTPQKAIVTNPIQKEVLKTSPRLSLKDVRYSVSKTEKKKISFPMECYSPLADLSSMTIAEYNGIAQSKKSFEDFFGKDCTDLLKDNATFDSLLKTSGCNFSTDKNGACISLMLMLKANFMAELTDNKRPEEMTSEELASHLVRMFFSMDKLKPESFVSNLKIADLLYSKHMNDPEIIEAYLGYLMIGQKITGVQSVRERIDTILAESEGNSFKVDRLLVIKEALAENLAGAREVLDGLQSKYPQEPDLHYYYAAYHWKTGNRELALASLDRAIAFGTNCRECRPSMYEETKRKLVSAKDKDDQLFSISIGLNFDNL